MINSIKIERVADSRSAVWMPSPLLSLWSLKGPLKSLKILKPCRAASYYGTHLKGTFKPDVQTMFEFYALLVLTQMTPSGSLKRLMTQSLQAISARRLVAAKVGLGGADRLGAVEPRLRQLPRPQLQPVLPLQICVDVSRYASSACCPLHPSIHMSACPLARLPICLSPRLSVCSSICPRICRSVRRSVHPSIRPSIRPPICACFPTCGAKQAIDAPPTNTRLRKRAGKEART